MKKIRLQISVLVCLLLAAFSPARAQYKLFLRGADRDSATLVEKTGIQTSFRTKEACAEYINRLTGQLQARGYVTASVDSIRYESDAARIVVFIGELYQWALLDTKGVEQGLLDAAGWREKLFTGKPLDFNQVKVLQEKMLDHLENTGYPFARIYLDSLLLDREKVTASLKVNKGPLYKIDSIRIYGDAKISGNYLRQYLEIPDGTIYSKEKLLRISKKLRELPYIVEERPADITLLATGSVVNLYLKEKKSSQVNVLIGFLPNNDQLSSKKLLLTGEANILLRNALGEGETIGVNWQQIQVKSPRLNLLYQHPYIFRLPLGLDFSFDMFKKDSSFLNVNFQLGAQYTLNANQWGKLFLQRFQTIVSPGGVDTLAIIRSRQLPVVADVSLVNLGLDYELNTTDYRFNPKKGNELRIITTIGTKKIRKSNDILELKDPSDPTYDFDKLYEGVKLNTYQLRVKAVAARYFPVGRQSAVKVAFNGGVLQSGNVFRNELFQLGGYKLLRGFDEESQYLSHYAIGTVEYRLLYITGQNSFLYALADGGWGQNSSISGKPGYTYFGTGLGIAFETKAGIFNLAWAIGKRNDTEFNLRQSKIHFGFINYF
ncbi:MAG: BamA/TamA family outer membrane protein [Chitinophagaceae bacterium]|nr:BamA/TamA family outer membrane protein [Chitinophagaceae bacterium]